MLSESLFLSHARFHSDRFEADDMAFSGQIGSEDIDFILLKL